MNKPNSNLIWSAIVGLAIIGGLVDKRSAVEAARKEATAEASIEAKHVEFDGVQDDVWRYVELCKQAHAGDEEATRTACVPIAETALRLISKRVLHAKETDPSQTEGY